jgi:adenylate kinase family enzyme
MERVLVAGMSGAGKSTLARQVAASLRLPYVELDGLFHGPRWEPRAAFLDDVRTLAASPRWVTEWQYAQARGLLLERADTVIWLDFDRRVVMSRVIRRSMRRAAFRQRLFNDNVERWRDWLEHDHPVRWAWTHLERKRDDFASVLTRAEHIELLRFHTPRQARRWLRGLRPVVPPR